MKRFVLAFTVKHRQMLVAFEIEMAGILVAKIWRYVQPIRVTNQLKSVISGGESDESNRLKAKRAEEQQLKKQEIFNAKISKLEKEKSDFEKTIKARKADTNNYICDKKTFTIYTFITHNIFLCM